MPFSKGEFRSLATLNQVPKNLAASKFGCSWTLAHYPSEILEETKPRRATLANKRAFCISRVCFCSFFRNIII